MVCPACLIGLAGVDGLGGPIAPPPASWVEPKVTCPEGESVMTCPAGAEYKPMDAKTVPLPQVPIAGLGADGGVCAKPIPNTNPQMWQQVELVQNPKCTRTCPSGMVLNDWMGIPMCAPKQQETLVKPTQNWWSAHEKQIFIAAGAGVLGLVVVLAMRKK